MTTPIDDLCDQPRENQVPCQVCGLDPVTRRPHTMTGNADAICDAHDTRGGAFTNGFVRRTADISYRRLDYWCRAGLFGDDKATGSGHDRRFTAADVRTAVVLARLTEHMPSVSLEWFGPAVRSWCVNPSADPAEHAIAITATNVVHLDDMPTLGVVATIVTVPALLLSQAPAGLGGDQLPAAGAPDRHGSAAVPVTSSTAPPAVDVEAADASAAVHDHARTRTAGPSTGTATGWGVDGTFATSP